MISTPINASNDAAGALFYTSINRSFANWIVITSLNNSIETVSNSNTVWGLDSIHLLGTQIIGLNLTQNADEYSLTNNSLFKFSWYFTSRQFNYLGFILFTPNDTYRIYIVSYFKGTFANTTSSAIYEYKNEQINTWYEHQINLTAMFLQAYSTLPPKVIEIEIVNTYFGSCGCILTASNQESYFDDFLIYSGNISSDRPTPPPVVTAVKGIDQISKVPLVNISWEEPTVAVGSVHHYNIFKSQYPTNNFTFVATTTNLSYIDTNVFSNQTYYYKVQSMNIFGDSDFSQVASTVPKPIIFPSSSVGRTQQISSTVLKSSIEVLRKSDFSIIQLGIPTTIIVTIISSGVFYSHKKKTRYNDQKSKKTSYENLQGFNSHSGPWYLVPFIVIIGVLREFVPYFMRAEALEHPLRNKIVQILEENQYEYLNSLKVKLQCRMTTLLWHLQELEKNGFIEKEKYERYTIIFLKGKRPTIPEIELYLGLQSIRAVRILNYILENSPVNLKNISIKLILRPSVIRGILNRFIVINVLFYDESSNVINLKDEWKELLKKSILRRKREMNFSD